MDAERSGVCSRGDEQCLKVRQIKNKKITQHKNINKHVCHRCDSSQARMISAASYKEGHAPVLSLSAFLLHDCLQSPMRSCQKLWRFLGSQPSDRITGKENRREGKIKVSV